MMNHNDKSSTLTATLKSPPPQSSSGAQETNVTGEEKRQGGPKSEPGRDRKERVLTSKETREQIFWVQWV